MKRMFVALVAAALAPVCALAVDGQVLINQSTLTAMGGTYTITQGGSYKLSGNLTVPDANTTAIVIAHDNVTIDLNGFSITGPVTCPAHCGSLALGHGIRAGSDSPAQGYFNITIRNGMIQGVGADGVHLLGDNILVEDLRIRNVGLSGILVRTAGVSGNPGQASLVLHHNTIQLTGTYGIKTYGGAIADNAIDQAGGIGIGVQDLGGGGGVVARNVVSRSAGVAFELDANTSYYGNTLVRNNSGGAQVAGGVNLGQNLCGTVACP